MEPSRKQRNKRGRNGTERENEEDQRQRKNATLGALSVCRARIPEVIVESCLAGPGQPDSWMRGFEVGSQLVRRLSQNWNQIVRPTAGGREPDHQERAAVRAHEHGVRRVEPRK